MRTFVSALAGAVALAVVADARQSQAPAPEPPVFRTGVEVVSVTATVSDRSGRFVPGLTADDFTLFEDDVPQALTYFKASRAPVSLGLALDTSGSMVGEKIDAARAALDRFLNELLSSDDEVFMYRFSDRPYLVNDWTTNRAEVSRALERIQPAGGTALYDTVAAAVPLAQEGRHQKKALLIISDGNDTSSRLGPRAVVEQVRQSDVLVYAIGIDGEERFYTPRDPGRGPTMRRPPPQPGQPRFPVPGPRRLPGGGRWPGFEQLGPSPGAGGWNGSERVNASALRELTDDSGGRTEIIRKPTDLRPATAGIADELSRQYELAYVSTGRRDGKWHDIRVELRNKNLEVRARRGFFAR